MRDLARQRARSTSDLHAQTTPKMSKVPNVEQAHATANSPTVRITDTHRS